MDPRETLTRIGRKLLAYHCSGSDTVLGSVNVAGSVAILLVIGFIVGVALTTLIFCLRLRKVLAYEIEYRERFGQLTRQVPDVSCMVKSAEASVFRGEETLSHPASGVATTIAPGPSRPSASLTLLPKSSATLASGPLASGFNPRCTDHNLGDSTTNALAASRAHSINHTKSLSFLPDGQAPSNGLHHGHHAALRRASTLDDPPNRSGDHTGAAAGSSSFLTAPMNLTRAEMPPPPAGLHSPLHQSLVASDLIPAHFGEKSIEGSTRTRALQRSAALQLSSISCAPGGLDTAASVILAQNHHATLSGGPPPVGRGGNAWAVARAVALQGESSSPESDTGIDNNNSNNNASSMTMGMRNTLSSYGRVLVVGPLEHAAVATGGPVVLPAGGAKKSLLVVTENTSDENNRNDNNNKSDGFLTPRPQVKTGAAPGDHAVPSDTALRRMSEQAPTPAALDPGIDEGKKEGSGNPFATTPEARAAHRAALFEMESEQGPAPIPQAMEEEMAKAEQDSSVTEENEKEEP